MPQLKQPRPPPAACGDDDRRRTFSPPREGLPLCVAPYFADRGVGDMRGPPTPPTKMPPRRRWQAVIAPHDPTSHTRDTQHVARNTIAKATAPHRLRGAIGWNARRTVPACRHDPAWRNTGLRTDATTSGVANYLAFCHRQRRDRHIGIPKQRSAESVPSPLRCEHHHCRNAANLFTTCNYAVVPGQHSIYHVRANDTPLPSPHIIVVSVSMQR